MVLRRTLIASTLALVTFACEPTVPQQTPPSSVVTALFDPTQSQLPLPNDLLLQQDPTTLGLPPAQAELLNAFKEQHGFPNDQEVAITIDFARSTINSDGTVTLSAPQFDFTSFTAETLIVFATTNSGQGTVELDPSKDADYVAFPDHGELTLHHKGRLPWTPGQYTVLVRGGLNGIKTQTGEPVYASQIFYLIEQGQDLTTPQNIGLIRAKSASQQDALAQAQQLNQLIAAYQPAFAAADTVFPHQELAVLTTFTIAPTVTQVQLDPNRGLVPLPIDLLRDPRPVSNTCPTCGHITARAACTLAQQPASTCPDSNGNATGAAAGFAALDGFSTTGAMLAPTSELVNRKTIDSTTIYLYDLTNPAAPVRVDPSTYIAEPVEFTSQDLSPVIAIQPAGATSDDASSVFRTKPLKDNTSYAVVLTNGIKDKAGNPIGPGTVGRILLFDNPLVDGTGKSNLTGVDNLTAGSLEVMRQQLAPVVATIGAAGVAKANIAMAYTFHTQSILSVAAGLGALPYATPAATALPGAVTVLTPAAAFTKYGVDPGVVPNSNIQEVLETTVTTFNLLDNATGAFKPDPTQATPETIKVLIAVPKSASVPVCTAPLASLGRCAPMMVFRHGLGGGRVQMLTVADSFAAHGLVTVSIDAAKHGDRSFCNAGDKTTNLPGFSVQICNDPSEACASPLPPGAQGDAKPPGICAVSGFAKRPVSSSCIANAACAGETDGIPFVSSNFLISANFFRTRDTFRQDIIDQSQLIRAIAFIPPATGAPPFGHSVFDHMLAVDGLIIDPRATYFSGQSLGAIQGTADVAANPRISKAVLNVGGGTVVDVFTNSPAFKGGVNQLLASLGIIPGTAGYLQFLVVAKTILDPADPINFAGHITGNTLPNLLSQTGGNLPPKTVLTQVAYCDQTVPNPFNFLLAENVPTGPLLPAPGFGSGTGTFEIFVAGLTNFTDCPFLGGAALPTSAVNHGFITDWVRVIDAKTGAERALTQKAQNDAAAFVVSDTLPPSVQTPL